jgi:C4-dicarboxylate transporter
VQAQPQKISAFLAFIYLLCKIYEKPGLVTVISRSCIKNYYMDSIAMNYDGACVCHLSFSLIPNVMVVAGFATYPMYLRASYAFNGVNNN